MILVLKFDDIKKDIETQWLWGNTEDKDKFLCLIFGAKMLQLRRKLMSLMDGQYQGQDGIMVEATKERDHDELPRYN